MSRIGKQPVQVPANVKVKVAGGKVTVEGPKSPKPLEFAHHPLVRVAFDEGKRVVTVTRGGDDRFSRSLHGLTRSIIANMVEGVVKGYEKRLKINVAQVLKEEGFIYDYQIGLLVKDEDGVKQWQQESDLSKPKVLLRVFLKYGPEGERVIRNIERASRPGRRLYFRSTQLRPVLNGLGISILSTSKGVMSDRRARAQKLGGEMLCTVY